MQTVLIKSSAHQARQKWLEYRDAVREGCGTKSDEILSKAFYALSRGRRVLDLGETMRSAGLDEQLRPRLAICRADKRLVRFVYWSYAPSFYPGGIGSPHWSKLARRKINMTQLPRRTFEEHWAQSWEWRQQVRLSARVPSIPPSIRPSRKRLKHYKILWEVDWEDVPADPILLSPIGGHFYAVVAQWDLTELERSMLRVDPV